MQQDVVVFSIEELVRLRETAEEIANLAERTLDACTDFAAALGPSAQPVPED